jgi:hypothetical protein
MHFGNGIAPAIERPVTPLKARAAKAPKPELVFRRDVEFNPAVHGPIKGVCRRGEVGFLIGASSVGKTFTAIDLGLAVATGRETWCGRRVKPGAVLHVAFEGGGGARNRLLAASQAHGDPGDKFAILDTVPPLNRTTEKAESDGVSTIVAAAIQLAATAEMPVALIIIDTLSAAAAGDDENAAGDMSAFVAKAKAIATRTGAAVLIIHHTGKDKNGMRGSSALRSNADFAIEISEGRDIILEKCREGRTGALASYDLEEVTLGIDDDGDAVTSCIVRFKDARAQSGAKPTRKLSNPQRQALEVLRDLYGTASARAVPAGEINGIEIPRCVRLTDWRSACRTKRLTGSEDDAGRAAEAEKKAFQRAKDGLEAAGLTASFADEVWLTGQRRGSIASEEPSSWQA